MNDCKHIWLPGTSPADNAAAIERLVCILCGKSVSHIECLQLVTAKPKPEPEAGPLKAAA